MFKRKTSGSIVCPSCGRLVGINDPACHECGRRNPGLWGFAPVLRKLGADLGFANIVIGGCAVLYLVSLLLDPGAIRATGLMSMLAPSWQSLVAMGASGALPVFELGRWWTLLSAGWLHGGLLHIVFNMLWVRQLGPATVALYGPGRTVLIYTGASVVGFWLSAAGGTYGGPLRMLFGGSSQSISVGASAAIFGLLGALVYAGQRTGHGQLGRQAWGYAIALFLFGFIMRGIDNWAHLGGFLGGYLLSRWFDPLTPERSDHLIAGIVVLAMTAISVLYSVGSALGLLP